MIMDQIFKDENLKIEKINNFVNNLHKKDYNKFIMNYIPYLIATPITNFENHDYFIRQLFKYGILTIQKFQQHYFYRKSTLIKGCNRDGRFINKTPIFPHYQKFANLMFEHGLTMNWVFNIHSRIKVFIVSKLKNNDTLYLENIITCVDFDSNLTNFFMMMQMMNYAYEYFGFCEFVIDSLKRGYNHETLFHSVIMMRTQSALYEYLTICKKLNLENSKEILDHINGVKKIVISNDMIKD